MRAMAGRGAARVRRGSTDLLAQRLVGRRRVAAPAPTSCPDCGGAVEVTGAASQYQEDLPPVRPLVRRPQRVGGLQGVAALGRMQRSRPTPLFYRGPHAGRGLRRGAGSVSMRAAESRTLTAGSAFNEPVWATVLLDRRLSQATMIGIKGEGCRPGEQTHAVLLGRRTFVAPPADEGRQLKAGPLSMSHRTLWICPSRGRPLSVAPTPEVGEAGAHRPLEISRAIVAAHACVGAARFPQLHSASSSSITRHETDDEGVISEPEYTLTKPSSGPNHRDHLTRRVALRARSDLRLSTSTQDIWPAQPGCAGLSHPACPAVPPAPDPVPSRAMPVFGEGRASAAIGPAAWQWSTTGSKEAGCGRTRKLTVRAAGRAVRGSGSLGDYWWRGCG